MGEDDQKIGKTMPNGTVFAGFSPKTGQPMYIVPVGVDVRDEPTMTRADAKVAMRNLASLGWQPADGEDVIAWMKKDGDGREADPGKQRIKTIFMQGDPAAPPDHEEPKGLALAKKVRSFFRQGASVARPDPDEPRGVALAKMRPPAPGAPS